jgi:DnaJ-class molecular chaperone
VHRPLRAAALCVEKKSLDAMGLPDTASKIEVKARFKELVKLHHPDANGGDTRSEEKLREIIQAYNYLKTAGLV